jgi:hypothetical protein
VSFSKTGECSRIHVRALKSSGTHQYSLSDKVFKLLNIGQHFKSLLKINWACKEEKTLILNMINLKREK